MSAWREVLRRVRGSGVALLIVSAVLFVVGATSFSRAAECTTRRRLASVPAAIAAIAVVLAFR